jgi:hypothetical protein
MFRDGISKFCGVGSGRNIRVPANKPEFSIRADESKLSANANTRSLLNH